MSRFDELQLQRLVDGRLALDQVRQMIREAESDPESWRQIAVAFVEEQIWQSTLNHQPPSSDVAFPVDFKPKQNPGLRPMGQSNGLRTLRNFSSIAALLLLLPFAFWTGQMTMNREPAGSANRETQVPAHSIEMASDAASKGQIHNADRLIPEIQTPFTVRWGDNQSQSVPVMTETMARELAYDPTPKTVPEELQKKLRQSGFELQRNIQFVTGSMQDGREVIIPVELVRISSYGQ